MADLAGAQNQPRRQFTKNTQREKLSETHRQRQNHRVVPSRTGKRPVRQQNPKNCPGDAECLQKKAGSFAWAASQVKDSLRLYFDAFSANCSVFIRIFRYLKMCDLLDLILSSFIRNILYFSFEGASL